MIIENCTDYYGFLNGFDIVTAGKLVEKLQSEKRRATLHWYRASIRPAGRGAYGLCKEPAGGGTFM